MKKITAYAIISEFGLENVQLKVNQLLHEGWQPLGWVSVSIGPGDGQGKAHVLYSQAIVQEKPL
jgi:hypothetical protein